MMMIIVNMSQAYIPQWADCRQDSQISHNVQYRHISVAWDYMPIGVVKGWMSNENNTTQKRRCSGQQTVTNSHDDDHQPLCIYNHMYSHMSWMSVHPIHPSYRISLCSYLIRSTLIKIRARASYFLCHLAPPASFIWYKDAPFVRRSAEPATCSSGRSWSS